MDPVVNKALEEICSQGSKGLTLTLLWSKLHPHIISANGLNLCTNFKNALWSNLLTNPSLRFVSKGVPVNPNVQSVEDAEAADLNIVAVEHLRDCFVGIYDLKASDAAVSEAQRRRVTPSEAAVTEDERRVLERLAVARTDGVTQNELAKELGIKNNDIFYRLRKLETRGLIVKQATIVRKKEGGNDEYKNGSIVNTNMIYLYRYAKHLGHLQRLEITKEDRAVTDDDNAETEVASGDGVSEERVKDFVPDIRAICDRLEKADGKVLVVSDIKRELGYCKTTGHRAWRHILHKMKEVSLVEDFDATVKDKKVKCLRLLKNFSPETFRPKVNRGRDDDLDTEQDVKLVKRGQTTEQLLELPMEQQIYDMIDAEGSKGITPTEVCKRLGINYKRYYRFIVDVMVPRFRMHLDSEALNKGVVYRVWTRGNYNAVVPNTLPGISKYTMVNKPSTPIEDANDQTSSKVDAEASTASDTWLDSNDLQFKANDPVPNAELQSVTVKPTSNAVSLEEPPSASTAPRRRRSYETHPCLGLNSVNSLREQRILEKLQEEKVLIKSELHRLLNSIENIEKKQCTTMDKRTLARSLNKLQKDGYCKCISYAVPTVTNIGRKTVDVILHPSVYEAEDLSERVHDRLRLFEKQARTNLPGKCDKAIPVLNDVERINTGSRIRGQAETSEAMKNNGFVLAKMVRAKMLHVFLWSYLTGLPGWDEAIKDGDQKNPYSSCKLFELDAAIKTMALELFLQVAGSSLQLESMVEKCRNGLRLSDLPVHEYKCLMDTRATGRLSNLIDILRRLKLIRLIGGDISVGPHTTLRHSLEFKPYIEEPVGMVLPYTGINSSDLRPHARHDFVLASKKIVNEYWNTLEYCYAVSDPEAVMYAFPGSTVPEVLNTRSWASVRVMTAHQRDELFKIVANEDTNKKISFKKCEKIAENLNLTLEQVLRVFYDKRQKDRLKLAESAKEHESLAPIHALSSFKSKRSLKRKSPVDIEKSLDEESGKLKRAKHAHDAIEEEISFQSLINEIDEANLLINEFDEQRDVVDDDLALKQDENDQSDSDNDCSFSKLQSRQKRFSWTEDKDRLLIIEYVKYRVALGAKFQRVLWSSILSLPGPPDTCRRRMTILNNNKQFKKALMTLCNMLSVRYAIHLEAFKDKSFDDNFRVVIKDHERVDHTTNLNSEERWDDFDNKDIQMALGEVLKYKQVAKLEASKSARYISKYGQADVADEPHELDENNIGSTSTPTTELKKDGGKRKASTRRIRSHLPKSHIMLMNKVQDSDAQAYKSLAVSNAIELFKLIFLNTAKGPQVPKFLSEILRRYSEHDLFTAFNYLRDKKIMVGGNDGHYVLSQWFLHNISSSPFPVNTGKRAVQMSRWLHERQKDLLDDEVDLPADRLQCGDVLQLCVLMCTGEISMFPCLPEEGIGEIEDLKIRKCDDNETCSVEITKKPKLLDNEIFTRKEKGFPGIQLSISRSLISRVDEITLSGSNSLSPGQMEGVSMLNGASESTWEAMNCYARHLVSSSAQEPSPNLFKTVYSAIQKSGDQGLSMEEISHIVDLQGETMPELIVEVLEAFGRALKVNAFDSVHVVDSLYRSKYMLASHDHHLEVPERSDNVGEPIKLQEENHEDKHQNLMEETITDLAEVHTSTDEEQHRVTILNHPEEVSQSISEVHKNSENETSMSPRKGPHDEKCNFRKDDSSGSYKPILPWVNGDGTVNKIVFKGLVRRVLGIVMQNPGILEEHVLRQMNVLNPQSCRELLKLMILDSHITVRKLYQSVSNQPPTMLHRLLVSSSNKPKMICRQHLFANSRSIDCL